MSESKNVSVEDLPEVAQRFLRYVRIDTQSDPNSKTVPSTEKQKDLSALLLTELHDLGIENAGMDEHGYVYASLPPVAADPDAPTVGLVAHVDTSPDEPGGPVQPLVHRGYDGRVLSLPGDPTVTIDPGRSPHLLDHIGHDLITSDGTTLLGSDDKAGVAIIMQTVAELVAQPDLARPPLRICFTVDEEIGRGVDALDLERFGADLAYTIDGGTVGHFDTETFNACEARIEVRGLMVHPGTAKGVMVNALTILCDLLSRLPQSERPETTSGREGYFYPHELRGDVVTARTAMLLRDFEDEGMERRKQLVRALVEAARIENPGAHLELVIEDTYKNMKSYIEAKNPRAFSRAFEAATLLGIELEEQSIRGGTDGSRLSELGVPTPNIFTGGHDYHSRFEWNTVQNLESSLQFVLQLVGVWARG